MEESNKNNLILSKLNFFLSTQHLDNEILSDTDNSVEIIKQLNIQNLPEDEIVGKINSFDAKKKRQINFTSKEFENCTFKPVINSYSQTVASRVKPLAERIPDILLKQEALLEQKRNEKKSCELQECSFKPQITANLTDKYLAKGKHKSTPDTFFRYREEKLERNNERRKVLREMESKELTFKPQSNLKSLQLCNEKIKQNNVTIIDSKNIIDNDILQQEQVLMLESDHPYKSYLDEYITISTPNAIQYTITFDEKTVTKNLFDYIIFYQDESHSNHWGSKKYSGSLQKGNWPGQLNREPLLIRSSKFVVYFHTSNCTDDFWGFSMYITAFTLPDSQNLLIHSLRNEQIKNDMSSKPEISERAKFYKNDEPVHQRLYNSGISNKLNKDALFSERIKNGLRSDFSIGQREQFQRRQKSGGDKSSNILLDQSSTDIPVTVLEYNLAKNGFLWKSLTE